MSFRGEGTGPPNGIMDRVQDPPSWPASWAPGPTKNQDRSGARRLVWDGLRALGQPCGSRPLVPSPRRVPVSERLQVRVWAPRPPTCSGFRLPRRHSPCRAAREALSMVRVEEAALAPGRMLDNSLPIPAQ